jgi:exopolysaccharide production protein ExoZ
MTSTPRLDSLQALRAIAALMVVVFHLQVYTVPVVLGHPDRLWTGFGMGYSGVEIFFVLSGFIMVLVHGDQFGQPRLAWQFLMRRVERIYPMLWIVLVGLIALRWLDSGALPTASEALRAFTLWPTAGEPVLEASWSLTFEMLFYLVFALLLLHRRFGAFIAGFWFTLCLVSAVSGYVGPGAELLLSPYNALFLFGILSAQVFREMRPLQGLGVFVLGVTLYLHVGLGEAYGTLVLDTGFRTVVYGVAAAGIVSGLAAVDIAGRLKVPGVLRFLGDASFSIYLVHVMVMTIVVKVLISLQLDTILGLPAIAAVLILASLALGCLAHVALERPVLRWLRARRTTPPLMVSR